MPYIWSLVYDHYMYHISSCPSLTNPVTLPFPSLGTTKKGIGPTYSSKASRSGLRIADLFHFDTFTAKYRVNLANKERRFGTLASVNADAELARLKELKERVRPMVCDTIMMMHDALGTMEMI